MKIPQLYSERLKKLQARMAQEAIDVAAVAPTASMRYLTGFAPKMDERFCALLVSVDHFCIVVPELNADQVEAHTGLQAVRWEDAEGPHQALTTGLEKTGVGPGCVLAVDESMRADHLLLLQQQVHPKLSITANNLVSPMRMRKTEAEIDLLVKSAALADKALLAGADACRVGVSERHVAHEIANYFLEHGAQMVDFAIVASGPNGAFPHHETGGRKLEQGDTIIIDIGATLGGYKSDITRVVQLGEPSAQVVKAYQAVLRSNQLGRLAAVPGALAKEVDHAARQSLDEARLGHFFIHRTGHGLGLEVHEPPWITSTSETMLEPGMVFSIEPGVYIPGKFGIRIEDIVVITDQGNRLLTGLDYALIIKS